MIIHGKTYNPHSQDVVKELIEYMSDYIVNS